VPRVVVHIGVSDQDVRVQVNHDALAQLQPNVIDVDAQPANSAALPPGEESDVARRSDGSCVQSSCSPRYRACGRAAARAATVHGCLGD
jgi:hypothetical protein